MAFEPAESLTAAFVVTCKAHRNDSSADDFRASVVGPSGAANGG